MITLKDLYKKSKSNLDASIQLQGTLLTGAEAVHLEWQQQYSMSSLMIWATIWTGVYIFVLCEIEYHHKFIHMQI